MRHLVAILKNNVTRYDVTLIYTGFAEWGKIQIYNIIYIYSFLILTKLSSWCFKHYILILILNYNSYL